MKRKRRSSGENYQRSRSRSRSGENEERSRSRSGENTQALCQICKKPGLNHIRCPDCDLCSSGAESHAQHIAGKKHKLMVGLKKSSKEPDNVEVIEEKTVKGKLPPEKQSSTPKVPQSGKVGEKENNSGNKNEVNDIDKTGKPRSPPDTEKSGNKTGSKLPKLQLATRQLLSEVIEGKNSKPTSVPKVAQFGKRLCSWCNKPVIGDEHFHCDTCNICCQGHQAFEQHILGKDHALKFVKKLPEKKPSEEPKPVSPPADSQPPSDFPMCHGTGCDRKFVSIPALKKHIHEFHGFLIK